MSLAPGTRLGPYEILAPIGAGGMGEVYKARDTRLKRDVAVKVLPADFSADADRLRRFEQEAEAAGRLNHPNILAIHDVGSQEGAPYVVSELLEGETLRERLGGGALAPRRAVEYAKEITAGLAAAHEQGIVHRDLKPENIFVTKDGRLKILDFGLAKLRQTDTGAGPQTNAPTAMTGTQPGVIMGTFGYMSPEQVRGRAVDHRSDIFSFGSILYEMLTGARAFNGDTAADTMSAILKDDPPEITGTGRNIPPVLDRIVRHCLEKNPEQRFQSAKDLAFSLEALSSTSDTATAEALLVGAVSAPSGRRLPLEFLAGMAAGLIIGAGVATWLRHPPLLAPPTVRYLSYSGLDSEPSSSSDGRLIAYSSVRENRSQIWLKQHPGGDEVALTTGPADGRPRISPDGSSVLFVRGEASRSSLYKIAALGGEPRKVLDDVYDGDWSPDGRQVVFLRQRREKEISSSIVGVVDASGEGAKEIARIQSGNLDYPRWSPDGTTIAAVHSGAENAPNNILLVGADGNGVRTLAPPPPVGALSAPAWSGIGSTLVYAQSESIVQAGARGGSGRIIGQEVSSGRAETLMWISAMAPVIDIVGTGSLMLGATSQRQNLQEVSLAAGSVSSGGRWLTRGNSIDRQPTFSPDGQWVLFSSNRSGNLDLWKLSITTGAIRRITEDAADDWDPAFTPDGKQIIWSSSRGGHFEIWICTADGTGARQLTDDGVDAENPTATRDGQWVVYNSTNPAKSGLWKIHPDGTGATRIIAGTWSTPDVSPDGSYVAFRTLTLPRALSVARIADGEALRFPIEMPGDQLNGRPRWMPDGRSLVFTGTNESGARGVFVQAFSPGEDTRATRRAILGFDIGSDVETFGIAADGMRMVYSAVDAIDSLMLAEGLPGIAPPERRHR